MHTPPLPHPTDLSLDPPFRTARRRPRWTTALALRLLLVVILAGGTGACATLGGAAYDLSGPWDAELRLDGQLIRGTLVVDQMGRTMDATFRSPGLGVEATGGGHVTDQGEITLELGYDAGCPGTARLTGTLSEAGALATGRVATSDCTGDASGTFELERQ